MADSQPGNGSSSPFGNGAGGTGGGGGGKGNDFLTNPGGNPKPGGGRDFAAEPAPKQPVGPAVGPYAANPDSIPAGGRMPFMDPKNNPGTIAGNAQRKPFKLDGPPAPEAAPAAGPSDLPGGGGGEVMAGTVSGE